ncbi:hypothetical protein EJ05DRAFT_230013 [Pseudovirgaria hyperparasitica]|uniref:Signal peptide-containing protein n=1 Tax=Pseudovirgaria hyperparasitica TaxID=470096 RepID=A0A6A6VUR6_9PEZI|nr:uncharacterized protein EJ05DRAFT_230013 [Pseudovirgaria hyperparasitica]KAF2753007.1 hypothetical protein EJ05DRAFT_230013 [Pseudovirgaria hyperparasitica]
MSLMRGIQSAVFHYLSCAPCTQAAHRKKLRRDAKRDKAEREKLETEQPELYWHPHPNDTNEHWREEIILGPGPPPRRTKGKKSREGSRRDHVPSRAGTQGSITSHGGSSLDVPLKAFTIPDGRKSDDTLDGDNWNRKRYQREDEELWGFEDADEIQSQHSKLGGSIAARISRPGTAFSSTDSYFGRGPPVNDMHPPVVSMPSSYARDNKWMLQPPPKAKVMNGKVRANSRSRSGSGGSGGSGASSKVELSLQRQVSEKRLFEKMQRGETPEMPTCSRGGSCRAPSRGLTYDTNTYTNTLPKPSRKTRRAKTDSLMLPTNHTGSSSETMVQTLTMDASPQSNRPTSSSGFIRISTTAQRPNITVTESDGLENATSKSVIRDENHVRPKKLQHTNTGSSDSRSPGMGRRLPLFLSDYSLNAFQDRFTPASNTQKQSSSSTERSLELLPPAHIKSSAISGAQYPDEKQPIRDIEWGGSGFGVSREWIGDMQHVQNRWSMDI